MVSYHRARPSPVGDNNNNNGDDAQHGDGWNTMMIRLDSSAGNLYFDITLQFELSILTVFSSQPLNRNQFQSIWLMRRKSNWSTTCTSSADNVCCSTWADFCMLHSIDFLRTSSQDGTIKEDDKESLDVAGAFSSWLFCFRILVY